jgi:peptide/nickel transport system substrate-binding protein
MTRSGAAQAKVDRRTLLKASGASAAAALVLPGLTSFSTNSVSAQDAALLQVGIGTDIDHLDPRQINTQEAYFACANVYDCLVLYDLGAATIRPGLAESWTISDDGLVYTFTLRQGVTYHDGTAFNADAVIRWYNSIIPDGEGTQYDAAKMPYMEGFLTSLVSAVEKVDDSAVTFTLPKPYSPLLANLAIPIFGIPSPTAIDTYGLDLSVNPSGTGAFMLASTDDWVRDSQLTLTTNPDYWGGGQTIGGVVFKIAPESATRLQQVESGEIDVALFLTPDDVSKAKDNSDLVVIEEAGLNTNCVEFNVTKDPFTTAEVRQALNYAINKEELSQGLYNGGMVPAGGVLPPSDWAFNPDLTSYPYDLDKAKELLTTAGYTEDKPLSFTLMVYDVPRGYNPAADRLGTAIQEYWKQAGADVEIQIEEWTQYRADRRADKFTVSMSGWMGDNGEPDNFLYSLLGTDNIAGANTSWYSNPEVDDLLSQAQEVTDQETRTGLYHQAEQKIVDDAPWAFLGYQLHQVVTRSGVGNFTLQPTYIYYLSAVTKS